MMCISEIYPLINNFLISVKKLKSNYYYWTKGVVCHNYKDKSVK